MTVRDLRAGAHELDLAGRQSPIKIKQDGTCIWLNGERIEWRPVKRLEPETVPTSVLASVARDQMASGELDESILRELQVRYGYQNCPPEDKAAIAELDRSVFIPP